MIRQENPELEEFLWDDSYLADGYFTETVVIAQEEMAKHCIREQTSSRELKLRPLGRGVALFTLDWLILVSLAIFVALI